MGTKKKLKILLFLCLLTQYANAQFILKGIVKDSVGVRIRSISIVEKGNPSNGTSTNQDGEFSIQLKDNASSIIVSHIGYETQEININNRSFVEIVLADEESTLSEVVVVGYGVQKKSDLTGSIGSVKGESLLERPAINVEQSLAGRIAGVNVSTNSGRPGGRTSIAIRGFSSINASNSPLYIVDGVELTEGLADINPYDVESIDVLKDASATAIYGTRGSNGVIIVTTKRGNRGGTQIRYDGYASLNKLPASRKMDVLSAREWLDLEEVVYKNAEKFDPAGYKKGNYVDPVEKRKNYLAGNSFGNRELFKLDNNGIPQPIYDIDWSDEVFRTAFSQSHNLSFTGGANKTNYGLFLGYADDNGIIRESFQKRFNIRTVVDQQVKDWLKVGATLSYSKRKEGGVDDSNGSYNVIRNVIEMVPFIPFKYEDGTYGYGGDYAGLEKLDNPLSEAYENLIHDNTNAFNGNAYLNVKLMPGLDFTSTIGANVINEIHPRFNSSKLQGGTRKNSASINGNETDFWLWSNRLNYIKQLENNSSLNVLLGIESQGQNFLSWTSSTTLMPDDYYQYFNLGAGATPNAPSSQTNSYQMASYFSRVNYNFLNKYLFTVTGRFDGSSRFGENNKFAFFPSGAFAWRVSEEGFLKDNSLISDMKLRLGYGLTGNSSIGSYRSLANLSTNSYVFGNGRVTGSAIGRLANPNLKWEKTQQYNIGLDLSVLNNRLNFVADAYYKKTIDLLLDAPIPSTSGYTTVMKNIGNMENKGLEITINSRNVQTSTVNWSTDLNFSWLKNRVTALGSNNEDILYGFKDNQIIRVGESVGSIFGYIRDGIYSTDQVDLASKYGKKPGDVIIRDINQDGLINADDRAIIGKGIPDFYGTLSNNISYKNLYLIVDIQYQKGNQIFNNTRNSSEGRFGIANNYSTVLDSWTPDNQDAVLEQLRPSGYSYYMDTRKLSDGSFIRGKNLVLGYNFGEEFSKKLSLNSVKLYASVQNFFLITPYFGYDPELNNYNTAFSQGITYTNYPKPTTYLLGLSITL